MRPVILLFGAGASYGAGSILPEIPPLGSRLSAELVRLFPRSWGSLPASILSKLKDNFEIGMKEIWTNYDVVVPGLMQDMGIYFSAFRTINEKSLYYNLIRHIKDSGLLNAVIFSTLNYDCLIESAAREAGIPVSYFDLHSDCLNLWKLHGSCNFLSHGIAAGKGIAYSKGASFDAGIKAVADVRDLLEELLIKSGIAPAMCLYMEGKPVNTAPSAIASLQAQWAKHVSDARLVLSVGVRPVAGDTHIWGPIYTTKAKYSYCGFNSEFSEAITKVMNPGQHLGNTFSLAIDNIINEVNEHAHV